MDQPAGIVQRVLKSEGIGGLIRRSLRRLLRKPELVNLYVLALEREDIMQRPTYPPPLEDLEIDELSDRDGNDIEALAGFGFYGRSPEDILQYLAAGQQCFLLKHQGRVISCIWRAAGSYYDHYLKRRLDLDDNEEYLLGAFVLPELRGKGILPFFFQTTFLERLQGCPDLRATILIRTTNRSSLRTVDKSGFRTVGRMGFLDVLGIRFQYLLGRDALPKTTRRTFLQLASGSETG